jgi:predicted O-methyltransferase YrrM
MLSTPRSAVKRLLRRLFPQLQSFVPPGHFYSPLIDLRNLPPAAARVAFDAEEYWEHVDLRTDRQRAYYQTLLTHFPCPDFPAEKLATRRYHHPNVWFVLSDAFTLSGIIRKEKPRRIVEVGSGYSSAVMLDTLHLTGGHAELTFIEPYPERLYGLLTPEDRKHATILTTQVQQVDLAVFDRLEAQDILFIDSSHVAKVGSDVTHIFLRILPRLKPGVIVHFHDIFYPESYPMAWIREGRAWNESLVLRAFLIGNPRFEIVAFNPYAARAFPEIFATAMPSFLENPGGSIWLRKTG